MPVLIVGADTSVGNAAIEALLPAAAEVRAFVSSAGAAEWFRRRGVKVARGDVSDASHVGTAGLNTHSIVLIEAAAGDDRERAFAADPAGVVAAWVEAVAISGCRRVIWVGPQGGAAALDGVTAEVVVVDPTGRDPSEVAAVVAQADAAA